MSSLFRRGAFLLVCMLLGAKALATTDFYEAQDHILTCKFSTSGYGKKVFVIHDMEGYYSYELSSSGGLTRCNSNVSIHYAINGKKDTSSDPYAAGEVSQFVRDANYAWHALCWNSYSLGTEHEGFASNPAWFTDILYQNSARLVSHKCYKYGIARDRNHIIAHGQKTVAGWPAWADANLPSGFDPNCNTHTDPGSMWDWTKFMGYVNADIDNSQLVSKNVADNTTFGANQKFSCTWTLKNTGPFTWVSNAGNGYTLNYRTGTQMGMTNAPLTANTAPNANGTFTVNFTAPATSGTYTVEVQPNGDHNAYFGSTYSLTIVVGVPTITSQPTNLVVNVGQTATFSVTATSPTALGYQWRKGGTNINGATQSAYSMPNVQLTNAGFYSVVVTNAGGSITSQSAQLVVLTSGPATPGTGTGLRGLYYGSTNFTALKLSRVDSTVNFDWGTASPGAGLPADLFAVRWSGQVEPRFTETYTFYTKTDDGVRLWVNGVQLVNKWVGQSATEWTGTIALEAGKRYSLVMEYFENTSGASAQLSWSSPSQIKEVIPATQLYRPAPALAVITNRTVNPGAAVSLSAVATNWDQITSVSIFEDFESYADGTTSDNVMFRKPSNSGSTSAFLDTSVTNITTVLATFPGGNVSTRALKAAMNFKTGTTGPWVRLTTDSTANRPNPTISLTQALSFDFYTDKSVKLTVGVRETATTAAFGADGGKTNGIEWIGATGTTGTVPPTPTRTIAAGAWSTVLFDIPKEPATGFAGTAADGIVTSSTGKGTLEHMALVPNAGTGTYTVYVDNFAVVGTSKVTYSLAAGAPDGATINTNTGAFTWTPTLEDAGTTNTIIILAEDNQSPAQSSAQTFEVIVAPLPTITEQPENTAVLAGSNATFTVTATSLSAIHYQWQFNGTNLAGATAGSWTRTNAQTADIGNYRVIMTNTVGAVTSSVAVLSVNYAPVLQAIPNFIVQAGQPVVFTNAATDADGPLEALAYNLEPGAPAGADLDDLEGVFSWLPADAAIGTNQISIRVTDQGDPVGSQARSFTVVVLPRPMLAAPAVQGSDVAFGWNTVAGQKYRIYYKDHLEDPAWQFLTEVTAAGPTTSFHDTASTQQRFYCIMLDEAEGE